MGGGSEGMLPPLFAHGHRRPPMAMGGGSRQHHLQQVQILTVRREGGREGGRERRAACTVRAYSPILHSLPPSLPP